MVTCDSEFVQPDMSGEPPAVCPGGHYKFDSCVDEALYEWSMDNPGAQGTGDCDFEGHLAVVIVQVPEQALLDEGTADEREVIIPAGNYLVWTASSGAVTVTTVDTEREAWNVFEAHDARYALWEAGCDPNDLAGHTDCGESCARPQWADAAR